jgi:predicted enzyme related to lactoylglutathione lyase
MTTDAQAAGRFYASVVSGWTFGERVPVDIDYRMIERSDGGNAGGVMNLSSEMQQQGARSAWMGYIGVEDVDAALAQLQADGGAVLIPPWDVPGVGRLAMVADPQGAPFYLMAPEPTEGSDSTASDVFSVDEAQHVRWNELATTDPDAAIAFYGKHFGWSQQGEMDMGDLGKYQFIHHNGVMIGAVMPRMPQMPVSMWSYYIGVDDIDGAAAAVSEGGGQILNGPMEIPGGEFALNGMDPQGAAFGLVGPRNS